MRNQRIKGFAAAVLALSLIAACSDDKKTTSTTAPVACATTTPVKLQLQWVTQAQFAGYYAALDQGFYKAQCLDVTILEGAVDITPQTVLANGDADFAVSWVTKALASREAGANIVDIAQVFQRSGTLAVSFKDKNITSAKDYAGKKIGNWGYGNEFEVFAAMTKAGIDPATVDNVAQQFDMVGLLEGDIDAAEAMTYNEYAQVLEAKNPKTGKLYTADDLNVISYEEQGVGMLQDAIWADGARLSDATYKDTAVKFVAASLQGWAYCRDNVDACAKLVTDQGSALGLTHQTWQMNEVNKLIWPAADGVGFIQQAAWDRTAALAQETKNLEGSTVLTKAPDADAFTNDIVTAAYAILKGLGVDINGTSYKPATVTLTEGGA
ncbi:MAG: ABC transporter substrate-binding protein [Actinobacteria bacterium]|uniref:Thiamine pyrimidine synthase n=1 Tax=freshwater metagenome TaxID=449393 RepID=A0A6J7BQA0_9ZZZZ|nr:ABC transporter substrate-binding protein [Actinomycetota bacterium]MSX54073.1 ABC transporter substrate-binding protein [Actinomycetota bacterium]MTB17898.1 ABC transporter substrate-binding protein [Actinomycetota bacterium]